MSLALDFKPDGMHCKHGEALLPVVLSHPCAHTGPIDHVHSLQQSPRITAAIVSNKHAQSWEMCHQSVLTWVFAAAWLQETARAARQEVGQRDRLLAETRAELDSAKNTPRDKQPVEGARMQGRQQANHVLESKLARLESDWRCACSIIPWCCLSPSLCTDPQEVMLGFHRALRWSGIILESRLIKCSAGAGVRPHVIVCAAGRANKRRPQTGSMSTMHTRRSWLFG